MSEPTPKSPAVKEAQLAAFAAEHVDAYQNRGHIYRNLGDIAVGGAEDVTRITARAEYHRDENGDRNVRIPKDTEVTAATAVEFANYLRSVGGSGHESIKGRAEMLQEYERFEPIVAALKAELGNPYDRKQHPNFLGGGLNSMVFWVTEGEKKYAVRIPDGRVDPSAIDEHLAGAVLGRGMPHLEQIVAASYKDGVTVAEMMPGKEVGHLTVDEIRGISDEQLAELVDTIVAACERGIKIDAKPSNIFYDPEVGYGIVDYQSAKTKGQDVASLNLGTTVGDLAVGIKATGSSTEEVDDEYTHYLEVSKTNLEVLQRYRYIVQQKLVGADLQKALKHIDEGLDDVRRDIENYSNPEWIADRIAQHQTRKRMRAERARTQPTPVEDGWLKIESDTV